MLHDLYSYLVIPNQIKINIYTFVDIFSQKKSFPNMDYIIQIFTRVQCGKMLTDSLLNSNCRGEPASVVSKQNSIKTGHDGPALLLLLYYHYYY